jgi:hypothetical protein
MRRRRKSMFSILIFEAGLPARVDEEDTKMSGCQACISQEKDPGATRASQ